MRDRHDDPLVVVESTVSDVTPVKCSCSPELVVVPELTNLKSPAHPVVVLVERGTCHKVFYLSISVPL